MITNMKSKCVHCGEVATKVVKEVGVEIPLCLNHYMEYVEEEDGIIDNSSESKNDDEES